MYSIFKKNIESSKEFAILGLENYETSFSEDEILFLKAEYQKELPFINLYNYQNFVTRYFNLYSGVKRFILEWGTGAGKTIGSLAIAKRFLEEGGKKIYIIGLTKNVFLSELINNTKFGYVNNEIVKELKMLLNHNLLREYSKLFNVLKNKVLASGFVFIGYEKFYNDLFIFPPNYISDSLTYKSLLELIHNNTIKINIDLLSKLKNNLIIVDEFHNMYNASSKNSYGLSLKYVLDTLKDDIYCLLLSATLLNNEPSEIIEVASIIDHNFKGVKEDYFDGLIPKKGTFEMISKLFRGRISYFETRDPSLYPTQIFMGEKAKPPLKLIKCPMVGIQLKYFKEVYDGTIPKNARYVSDFVLQDGYTYDHMKVHPDKKIIGDHFTFSVKDLKDQSSKYSKLLKLIKVEGKKVIYHKQVNVVGIIFISELLRRNGYVEFGTFANDNSICRKCFKINGPNHPHEFEPAIFAMTASHIPQDIRQKIYMIYSSEANSDGKLIDILIGAQVIEESLNFKAVRHAFICSPPKNIGTFLQLLGRFIRSGSHLLLPVEKRNVKIYLLVSSIHEEILYNNMMDKYKVIKEVNKLLHQDAVDLFINQNTINTVGNPFANLPVSTSNISKKIDDGFYKILYRKEEERSVIALIKSIFKLQPVWTLKSLSAYIKTSNICNFNGKYVDDDTITLSISSLVDTNHLMSRNEFYILTQTQPNNYNFLSNAKINRFEIDITAALNINIDYETNRNKFYLENKNLSVLKLAFNIEKYNKEFHILYCQEIIKYIFNLLDGKKKSEMHNFYLKVLYFYDKYNLIIYASQVPNNQYNVYVNETVETSQIHKTLLYSSLSNSSSINPVFDKFNNILDTQKMNPDYLPVGHYIDHIPYIYLNDIWEQFYIKLRQVTTKDNDYIVGYLNKGKGMLFEFKLKYTSSHTANKDKRKQKKGNKCSTIKKSELLTIAKHLNISITDSNIDNLCNSIKMKLLKNEITDPSKKWFYMHFEN
jgi:superfamily II DNA or RNA helicase